ncbi:MAG: hypothetical protein ACR2L9_04505 [Solirubrobacteraceae bacterium]
MEGPTTRGGAPADGITVGDPVDEARRILDLAASASLGIRVMGGVAVRMRCPSADLPPLARSYNDIDYAARSADSRRISELFAESGYQPDAEFNALHGRQRLFFWDPQHGRDADVFLDTFSMCHTLDFREQLLRDDHTLPLTTLLLFKLQVVETNDKDYKDALAILTDHRAERAGLDAEGIGHFLAQDWGWWRTATSMLDRLRSYAGQLEGFRGADAVNANVEAITAAIERAPKSRRWKLRSKVGERVRWYEVPDEAHA